ncbi:MAG: imidazolonepropionase [Rhodospirillales bacterium]|nr:imidazolonepropionase [Rhodospirillales bacterium]
MARWDTLLANVHLATVSGTEPYGIVENAALAISAGRIAWLGPARDLPGSPQDLARRVLYLGGRWATPGLIDCHTHLVYGGNRAREFELMLKGVSYTEIFKAGGGIRSTMKATRAADEDELFATAAGRMKALLGEGVTTLEIKSGYGLDLDTELRMLRVARRLGRELPVQVVTTFLGAHACPPEHDGDKDGYIDFVTQSVLPRVVKEGLADAVDGFYDPLGFSAAQIDRLFAAAKDHGLPVKLHAEQFADLNGGALVARHRALSADHMEYVSPEGIAAMAGTGTVAVLLPGAFYFTHETQVPPVAAMRARGLPVAVATDSNPGSSPALSLVLMMNMACVLFRLTPDEALKGVTIQAARALGLAADRGTLEVGKRADIAVWDIGHPVELSYAIGANPCAGAIRGGDVVLDRGAFGAA